MIIIINQRGPLQVSLGLLYALLAAYLDGKDSSEAWPRGFLRAGSLNYAPRTLSSPST